MENKRLHKFANDWLIEATIDSIQEKYSNGELTAKEVVLLYLDRISNFDSALKSVIEINPDAIQIAMALDAERKENGPRGPLHGIPVLLKDNLDTNDKMHTSAGSLALADSYAQEDSYVAYLLREAGAIILGKTNMTEWANFMTEGMPSGYSSRGGQTLNPYGPGKFDVGGSSAGSGSAIAANFAVVAIGTETSGSILSPSSQNSLVGIKPTVGLVSRSGIIPIAHTQDTAGPMARTVKDAAYLLSAISKVDHRDSITYTSRVLPSTDFTQFLAVDGLKGARIGIAREVYFDYLSKNKLAVMDQAINKLKELGATVIEDVRIPSSKNKWNYDVLTYEFKVDLNNYLRNIDTSLPIHNLADLIAFNKQNEEKMLKYGQVLLEKAEKTSGTLKEKEYIEALESDHYHSTINGIDYVLEHNQLDAVVFPNNFGAGIPAKAGYPSITIPAGYTPEGEPVGITFTGTAYSEPTLIKLAYSFEQGTKFRIPPKL
ncbi:amidase family protein [Bacillus sinesaloumensis]|uniref:amidase family protein n=1 Tax=Litchfieldia sinesaloumensis TaxID=1926280 RepID=UPI00098862E6|nr:amidase family protein [Bacillus sinesaloumensis]